MQLCKAEKNTVHNTTKFHEPRRTKPTESAKHLESFQSFTHVHKICFFVDELEGWLRSRGIWLCICDRHVCEVCQATKSCFNIWSHLNAIWNRFWKCCKVFACSWRVFCDIEIDVHLWTNSYDKTVFSDVDILHTPLNLKTTQIVHVLVSLRTFWKCTSTTNHRFIDHFSMKANEKIFLV